MRMHVSQAGNEKFTVGGYHLGVGRDSDRVGFSEGANAIRPPRADHDGHIGLGRSPGRVYHCDMREGEGSSCRCLLGMQRVGAHHQYE